MIILLLLSLILLLNNINSLGIKNYPYDGFSNKCIACQSTIEMIYRHVITAVSNDMVYIYHIVILLKMYVHLNYIIDNKKNTKKRFLSTRM